MKKMFLAICLTIAAFYLGHAQQTTDNIVELTPTEVKNRDVNPHIKKDIPTTDAVNPMPDKSRGIHHLDFDNLTGYFIKLYIDGNYMGTVAPWGHSKIAVTGQYNEVYGITTGNTYQWQKEDNYTDNVTFKLSMVNSM